MSAIGGVPVAAAGRRRSATGASVVSVDRMTLTVAVIVLAQAIWLGVIMGRGWFTDADLPNLGAATGVPMSWQYLTSSVGGHFGPPARLAYWLLNRAAPLNWPLTVAIRLVLQAAGTLALWRLLVLLVGRRPWLPVLLLLYSFNPLLVPGLAWLTSGLGLVIGQLAVCLMLIAWVRYLRTGALMWGALAAFWVLGSLVLADQTLPCLLLLPLLSLGFVTRGTVGARLKAECRRWPGWLMIGVVLAAYAVLYLHGSYNTGSSHFGLRAAWSISRSEWLEVIGPALIGGPWRWASNPDSFVSYSTPATSAVLCGQLAFVILLVLSLRVRGLRALLGWAVPVLIGVGSVVLVGKGRYDVLGTFVTPLLRYSFYLAVALAVGIALAFAPVVDEDVAHSALDEGAVGVDAQRNIATAGVPRQVLVAAVVAILAGSVVSGTLFAGRFWQNPAKGYVANVVAGARSGGPSLTVYDTASPPTIAAYVEPNHFLSDILGLARVRVRYEGSAANPLVAAADGRLSPAVFYRSADSAGPLKPACGTYVHGVGTWRIELSAPLVEKDWFVRLELYQPRDNTISVNVQDARGRTFTPVGGAVIHAVGKVVATTRRVDTVSPAAIVVHSADPATNLCLVHTYVGVPLARGSQ